MDSWFTVEQIDQDTFVISEYKHWEETHCYLLCGTKRAILIDTGLGVSNIREVIDGLTKLPVTVITTHVHWDHIGGHKYFRSIAVHEAEKEWLSVKFPIPLQVVKNNIMCNPCDFPSDFNVEKYQIFQGVHDEDCIDLGNRKLVVIHTPGHSPGHCCFYEADRKYLYSGDLIYSGCLDAFYPSTNPQEFWKSVRKIQSLKISRILPGHHHLSIPVTIIAFVGGHFINELLDKNILSFILSTTLMVVFIILVIFSIGLRKNERKFVVNIVKEKINKLKL